MMSPKKYSGFTLIELMVVVSIIGVLAALILPAVQQAREAGRRTQCLSNLRQLGLATLLFHDTYGCFPPGRISPRPDDLPENQCGGDEATWAVHIMPFTEQFALRNDWNPYEKWFNHPYAARVAKLPIFTCPSRRSSHQTVGVRPVATTGGGGRLPCGCPIPGSAATRDVEGFLGDYAGNHGDLSPGASGKSTDFYYGGNGTGVLITARPLCESGVPRDWIDKLRLASALDGTGTTILIGERHVASAHLKKFPNDGPLHDGGHLPASMRLAGPGLPLAQGPFDTESSFYAFGSWHAGCSQFVMLDGSVRAFSTSMDTVSLGQLTNRANSEIELVYLFDE